MQNLALLFKIPDTVNKSTKATKRQAQATPRDD
jgi:hypothetical protein